ncbi:MAG: Re/Si-specific NAD(P)(+) transhydrogenase subunit alpha [Cyanobacteria bacterium P01_F01_bin.42]
MTIALEKTNTTEVTESKQNASVVAVPKEIFSGECRVAATPETSKVLAKMGFHIRVESGAGEASGFTDKVYEAAGCEIVSDTSSLWGDADIVLKVRPPAMNHSLGRHEADLLPTGKTLISFIWPAQQSELLDQLNARQATVLAMDAVPRISRAQKLDALSSMANIAGYRSVIEAAHQFGRFFTGQITAAGKVPPAKVLVIGAGVAGLAAIGAAKGLGAIVRAFDTRPVVKEQVESMGGQFLELEFEEDGSGSGGYAKVMSPEFIKAEMELFAEQAKDVDIIITTALIPGKKAPLLITKDMVESMKPGSVIVDLAAEQGGNCEVSEPDTIVDHHGVKIVGYTDLPSRMGAQSSQLYGTNLCHLLKDMGGAESFHVDCEDYLVRGALILNEGQVMWPPPPLAQPSPAPAALKAEAAPIPEIEETSSGSGWVWIVLAGLALVGLGLGAPESLLSHFTLFIMACFVGWQIIWNVAPALHTPLMSVTNAISGIIILGGMLEIVGPLQSPTTILGALAILVGTINIAGGFLVTQRMLKMFRK